MSRMPRVITTFEREEITEAPHSKGVIRRRPGMKRRHTEILAARDVRGSFSPAGDIRSDVAFQNDVNSLLARLDRWVLPWTGMSDDTHEASDDLESAEAA